MAKRKPSKRITMLDGKPVAPRSKRPRHHMAGNVTFGRPKGTGRKSLYPHKVARVTTPIERPERHPQNPYKVQYPTTANRLAAHLRSGPLSRVKVTKVNFWWEVSAGYHPYFRELCEAFVAGYKLAGGTE